MDQPSQVHTESEHRWDLNEAPSVYTNMFISVDRSMKKFFQKARVNFRRYWNLRTWEISKGTLYYRWSWFHRITKCIQWNLATCWVVDFKDKMQPTLLLCSSYQALNLTLILRPAFWISISFTNQSKDGWALKTFCCFWDFNLRTPQRFRESTMQNSMSLQKSCEEIDSGSMSSRRFAKDSSSKVPNSWETFLMLHGLTRNSS